MNELVQVTQSYRSSRTARFLPLRQSWKGVTQQTASNGCLGRRRQRGSGGWFPKPDVALYPFLLW